MIGSRYHKLNRDALIYGVWGILFSLPIWTFSQNSQAQIDTLSLQAGDTLFLSHSNLVPFSAQIIHERKLIPLNKFIQDHVRGTLIPKDSLAEGSYVISYRYFTQEIPIPNVKLENGPNHELEKLRSPDVFFPAGKPKRQVFWESGSIRKSGSLTRGLTVGNQRGAAINNGLRLQLEGDLGDGLSIVGSITDENIPIQPDGTTQQINDFDRVFIKLMKDDQSLTLGDYAVSHKGSQFANYYRNVQGMMVETHSKQVSARFSGAVAKGKFHTNRLIGKEGVSGPYRLTGKNGERYFFVLAGSEKVYLNGKLLKRGESFDYTIDYNQAEITFSPLHVINSSSRIVVDFEYNDQYYNRSLVLANLEHRSKNDKLNLRFSYARDGDNPNAPFEGEQSFGAVRDSLSGIGDAANQAVTSSIQEVGFDEDAVRYAQRDTLIGIQQFTYYAYSTQPNEAIYQIFFSFVGANKGNYIRDRSGINGNIFTWIPPDAQGIPQGDHAPVRQWVLPRLLEVVDGQLTYQLNDKVQLFSETAMSREDQNRLSRIDDSDNIDLATRNGLKMKNVAIGDSSFLDLDIAHQFVGKRYTNLDRVYQAEYDRVWNLPTSTERVDEHIATSRLALNLKNQVRFETEQGLRNTGDGNVAYRQRYMIQSNLRKFLQGNYTLTHIESKSDSIAHLSSWLRQEGDVFAQMGRWKSGVEIWVENKEDIRSDTLSNGTFRFTDLKPYIRTLGTEKFQMDLSWNYRAEEEYFAGSLRPKSTAHTYFLRTQVSPNPQLNLQLISSYRTFEVLDSVFSQTGLSDSRVLNTNLQFNFQSPKPWFRSRFVYDVASEQLARRELRYIEVNPGQGQYVWEDINLNGIQEIDEFQIGVNPLTANFIRVALPSRELFPTGKLSFNGNIHFDLRRLIEKSGHPIKELVRNTRAITRIRALQHKARGEGPQAFLINFTKPFADTSLLNASISVRQDLSFFAGNPAGDIQFSFLDNQNKLFLSTGNEYRGLKSLSIRPRWNFQFSRAKSTQQSGRSLEWETRFGRKFAEADSFSSRNFDILFWETRPQINFQVNRKMRYSFAYSYASKENTSLEGAKAKATLQKLIMDAKVNVGKRNNIMGRLELVRIRQNGETNFSTSYELNEGLEVGNNAIWQMFITYYLFENVELSFVYDGRISSISSAVHSGRVQVRALF